MKKKRILTLKKIKQYLGFRQILDDFNCFPILVELEPAKTDPIADLVSSH